MRINRLAVLLGVLSVFAILIAACASTPAAAPTAVPATAQAEEEHEAEPEHAGEGENTDEHAGGATDEHADEGMEHEHAAIPDAYANLTNPLAGDSEAAGAGAELFASTCASCHGEEGKGDGPAAAALEPHPANLADAEMMAGMSDAYLFWRISEGGAMEPFNSAMPAWGSTYDETQIWQLVSFIRTLSE